MGRATPYAAFGTCCLIWGSTFLAIRIGNETLPPLWGASLRLSVATLVLAVIALAIREPLPRGATLRSAALFGFLEFGVSLGLLYMGEVSVPSSLAAILFAAIPLISMSLAIAFKIETWNARRAALSALGLVGVVIVFWGSLGGTIGVSGLILVLASAVIAALAGVLLKKGPPQQAISCNLVAAPVGAVTCLVWSLLAGETLTVPSTWSGWGPVLYLAIAGSVGAFVIFTWLLGIWKASVVSLIAVVMPVIAVVLGALVRQESLPATGYLGGAVVLISVIASLVIDSRSS